jgi:hypothetical protein
MDETSRSEHVMVPVPEEHIDDVRSFLMEADMRARARARGTVDAQALAAMVAVLSPLSREVLLLASVAALRDDPQTLREIAVSTKRSEYEVMGVVQELSERLWEAFGPLLTTVGAVGRPDKVDWNARKVIVWTVLAEAVVAAEQDLAEGP